ncbi:hypothetical protein KR059_003817, partial [Drosophila kikkawai]
HAVLRQQPRRASHSTESPGEPVRPMQPVGGTLHQHQGRIRAAITMEGRGFVAILDTGATYSFISEDLARELGNASNMRDTWTQVKLADGTCRELTRALAADIHLGNLRAPTILLVMSEVLDDVLLGMDFLCRIGATMQGYWQIPVAPASREYTAFTVPGRGLFHWKVMPFGLHSAPATFQRALDSAIGPELEPSAFAYLDDIIRSLKYLGHVISESGIHTDPDKIAAIRELQPPTNVRKLRRCLGVASWYRRFVPNFAAIVEPISTLLRKGRKWSWDTEQEQAFETLKTRLTEAPVLACPDITQKFSLQTDASDHGLGAVLLQSIDGVERVIAYASRRLTRAEENYSVTEKECLAILWAIRKMRCYLEGYRFEVVTDHLALKWLNSIDNPTGRIARWALELQQYQFDVQYRRGKFNIVADALSRQPLDTVQQANVEPSQCKWVRKMILQVTQEPGKFLDYRIEGGQLYRMTGNTPQEEDQVPWKLCVGQEYRQRVLQECHDHPTAGHLGTRKTGKRVAQKYYWPGLFREVTKYVRRGPTCQKYKVSQLKPAGRMFTRQVKEPFSVVCADFMGPFPRS